MKYPKQRILFTVKDISHACGVSRTTLIRMEECGFLTPYRIDSKTGYRYYDANNIAQIGQYQLLQTFGLSRKEITDFYFQRIDTEDFLKVQRQKINRLQRLLSKLEIRYHRSNNPPLSFAELPEVTCYCKATQDISPEDFETFTYNTYQKMIKEGFQVDGSEPIFVILPDNLHTTSIKNEGQSGVTICIPVIPPSVPSPNLKTFPACYAFTLIGYGDYSIIPSLFEQLWNEVSARNLKPIGPERLLALVAPYVGEHISPEHFCFECVVPVERIGSDMDLNKPDSNKC